MAYKAFVSSTFEDLKDHRAHVISSLRRAGVSVDPMEDWPADGHEPKQFSQDRLHSCDLCVMLVAFRRGYVPEGETRSIRGNKRVAHLEGSGQEGKTPRAPSRGSWGGVPDDDRSRHGAVRGTDSHPGCPSQQCRLHPEPHQSPIRIKASERAQTGRHSGPWREK